MLMKVYEQKGMVEGGSMHFGVGQFCHWTATDPFWAAVFLFELRHFPKLISGKAPSMWHCNSVHVCVCMCAHMCVWGGWNRSMETEGENCF